MLKRIDVTMNRRIARDLGFTPHHEFCHAELDVELDDFSGAARWILDHITATQVHDEYYYNRVIAEASFSMADRDRANGMSEEEVAAKVRQWGDTYTSKMRTSIHIPALTFTKPTLADALDQCVSQLRKAGAVTLIDMRTGDKCPLD